MKKTTLFIFLVLGLNLTAIGQDNIRPQSPKELGEAVFKAFQENNFESFLSLILNESDIDILVEKVDIPDSLKAAGAKNIWGIANTTRQNAKVKFDDALTRINEKNFVWPEAEVVQILDEIETRNGLELTEILLFFKSGEVTFAIRMPVCYKSDAWLMLEEIILLDK